MERLALNARYNPIEFSIHSCRYLPAQSLIEGKRVLDIACGEGIGTSLLLSWGAGEVVGVDLSQTAIDAAQESLGDRSNLRLVCEDAVSFLEKNKEKFDVIISVETIEHLPDPDTFVSLLAQNMDADTTLIMSCPNDYIYFGRGQSLNPYHLRQFSFYDFRTLAERHLGEAAWYWGTTSSGFSVVATDMVKRSADVYNSAVEQSMSALANVVPVQSNSQNQLKPSLALFYLGIWNGTELKASYQSSFAAGSDYRLPKFASISKDVGIGRTHRIAFVIDQHGWAFDNIVKNMQPYLTDRYNVDYYYIADYKNKSLLIEDIFVNNNYDNVHVMWREFLFNAISRQNFLMPILARTKLTAAELAMRLSAPTLTTSVYDHLYLRKGDIDDRQNKFSFVDGYATSSKILTKIYAGAFAHQPAVTISDGVDVAFFERARTLHAGRERKEGHVFKIGWVGNSDWGKRNDSMVRDAKGLHSILTPAVERLAQEGYPVELSLADRNIQTRSREEMVDYYSEIDILVCSSAFEGTPNPILEAMASGVAFVSTNVGIVPEVAGPLQQQFIIDNRTSKGIYEKLKQLIEEPDILVALEQENRDRIEGWNWNSKLVHWLKLFKNAEERNALYGRKLKYTTLLAQLEKWSQQDQLDLIQQESEKNLSKERAEVALLQSRLEKAELRLSQIKNPLLLLKYMFRRNRGGARGTIKKTNKKVAEKQTTPEAEQSRRRSPLKIAGAWMRRAKKLGGTSRG